MIRKISTNGLSLIKKFEGCHLKAYRCPAGVLTIGYGHTGEVQEGEVITQEQADSLLLTDCAWAESAVNSYSAIYDWTQNQFDALVSFTFNCGSGSLRSLLKSGARSIAEISSTICSYNKAKGQVLEGLVRRRKAEKELFDRAGATASSATPTYIVGKTYELCVDRLRVRTGPGTNYATKKYTQLTAGAKKHAYKDGCLKKGTKVTCQSVKVVGQNIWIKIPSGWVGAYYNRKTYIK